MIVLLSLPENYSEGYAPEPCQISQLEPDGFHDNF